MNLTPNENAPSFVFPEDEEEGSGKTVIPEGSHWENLSLDFLFPDLNFSEKFCNTEAFRRELRDSMREDIFDSTPAYRGMSEKARKMLLLPDSSLQGSWRCREDGKERATLRMSKLTNVLKEYLGTAAPSGDEFMETIGKLCGQKPSTHWIDIVGIAGRKIPHSWHQDTGSSSGGRRTVLLGFPKENNYDGVGVFSHAVKLKYERVAPETHSDNEPIVYANLNIPDTYIVKPRFAEGREILVFRDIDSLHSAPDVAYRTSVMRFM